MRRCHFLPFRTLALVLPLLLGGCGLTDWADANMPVIGERCEHWQCFTSSGQEASQLNHQQRVREESAPPANAMPANATPATNSAPTQPLAPAMPEEGAYRYVPRAPAAPGTTPLEGQIPPIE